MAPQDRQPLEIYDVVPVRPRLVAQTDFPLPSAFIFLYQRNIFLSFRDHRVDVWNFQVGRQACAAEVVCRGVASCTASLPPA